MTDRIKRYRTSLANGLLFHKLLEMLERAGLLIEPYYFYEEQMSFHTPIPVNLRGEEYDFCEATLEDVDELAAINLNRDTRAEILNEFREGRRCYALRLDGRIIASSWCDLNEIHFPSCRRILDEDEAYIYRTEVLYSYRGRDVASHLRTMIYTLLASGGRKFLYSYTDFFNRPAVRFKKKIGARVLFFGLSVRMRGLGRKNWIFRERERSVPAAHPIAAPSAR